jgi:D-serine deaminase-like pyridoxal phosphate-dependent protein
MNAPEQTAPPEDAPLAATSPADAAEAASASAGPAPDGGEAPRAASGPSTAEGAGAAWTSLLAQETLPAAMVDLDALDHNAATLAGVLGDRRLSIRLVTSELRSTGVLRHLFTTGPRALQGVHCGSTAEASLLAELGFDDLLIAVPPARPQEAAQVAELVAAGRQVLVVVDDLAQGQMLGAAARELGVEINVCVDVDATWQPVAEVILGVRRSALADSEAARALAGRLRDLGGLQVTGVMTWESGTAELRAGAHWWAVGPVRPLLRRRSAAAAADRRGAVVAALREDGHPIAVVNGGSTASLDMAVSDPVLTEVSLGGGFLAPLRCDGMGIDLRPAFHFALPVVRRPDPEQVACASGGWVGVANGKAVEPQVVWPARLRPVPGSGWGEAYSLLQATDGEAGLQIGDPVVCRPGQVAPVMERFTEVLLHRGDQLVERAPTYRGLGLHG